MEEKNIVADDKAQDEEKRQDDAEDIKNENLEDVCGGVTNSSKFFRTGRPEKKKAR